MTAPAPPRRLYYLPIVHTQQDLGGLGTAVKAHTAARLGAAAWERKQRLAAEFWTRLSQWATQLPAQLADHRLYQDGLPICGQEAAIVAELAEKGSRNHALLTLLVQRGARLMGTESPELLLQEYRLAQSALLQATSGLAEELGALLQRRDAFIARRIADTLQPGETGLLFIGALHQVAELLPADIRLDYPLRTQAAQRSDS